MTNKRTAFITGTAKGIGRATAEAFIGEGYRVIAHARKSTPDFEAHIADLRDHGADITPVYFDMLDSASMRANIKELKQAGIAIDVLVNNAGKAHSGLFQMTRTEQIEEIFAINLFAPMELTQLVLRLMRQPGAIVNVASIAGINLQRGNCSYGTSKAALIAFTKALSKELPDGIRVNAVAPSLTNTDMAVELQRQVEHSLTESQLGRWAEPEEVADVIVFLASDRASYINGQTICVDGGGI